ncbi:MAG: hypothetical protein P9L91_07390 [Candidatus Zophobacter franzmannii]|nr:hypothetical protein [Candidatus Zophobacter franzmannii]
MRCKHCNTKIEAEQVWCESCGTQTDLLKNELSVRKLIKEVWAKYKPNINNNYAIGFALGYAMFIPIIALVILHSNVALSSKPFLNYLGYNLIFMVFLPFAFLPFYAFAKNPTNKIGIKDLLSELKNYPQMLLFSFANILYFFLIKYICIGDPILNLVRVVLILWWPSIVLPVAFIVAKTGQNPFKVIKQCYKKLEDVRWKYFFIWVFLLAINVVGAIPAGIGLLVTLPFTYTLISEYTRKVIKYKLLD